MEFNDYLDKMYGSRFSIRGGINYGKAVVGRFDTGTMKKVSAIGDAVNLASRIESANKEQGTHLLLSSSYNHESHLSLNP